MERTTVKLQTGARSLRAQTEMGSMDREQIYQLIAEAKTALVATTQYAADAKTVVTAKAQAQYLKDARRIYGVDTSNKLSHPADANTIIASVRQAKTKSTLRKYARSVRHIALAMMKQVLAEIDRCQRAGDWKRAEGFVSSRKFSALIQICKMMPADYAHGWAPERKRKGKKASLSRLPDDWREQLAELSKGQYRLPTLVSLISGCRPAELEKGILLELRNQGFYITIQGAKVKENAGQEIRQFKLADHVITDELSTFLSTQPSKQFIVQVQKGNSVTTHLREIGKKLWPRRKETITCYTARHGMAADCKAAIHAGADPDLVSQVLGHVVDKTATYYGNRFQSGGTSVVPTDVLVTKQIRHKARERSEKRRENNKVPVRKRKIKFQPTF